MGGIWTSRWLVALALPIVSMVNSKVNSKCLFFIIININVKLLFWIFPDNMRIAEEGL